MAAKKSETATTEELLAQGTVRQRKVAALFLGITDRQLGNWTKEPWFPDGGRTDDGWNVPEILQARDVAGRKGSEDSAAARQMKLDREREQLEIDRAKKRRVLREEAEAAGNVLDRDEYELTIRESITVARDRFRSLPQALARLAGSDKLRAKILKEGVRIVDKILADLARQIETPPE